MNQAAPPAFVHTCTSNCFASIPISPFAGSYFLVLCLLGFSVLHVLEILEYIVVVVKYMKHFMERNYSVIYLHFTLDLCDPF
jgi:hypothetical protein